MTQINVPNTISALEAKKASIEAEQQKMSNLTELVSTVLEQVFQRIKISMFDGKYFAQFNLKSDFRTKKLGHNQIIGTDNLRSELFRKTKDFLEEKGYKVVDGAESINSRKFPHGMLSSYATSDEDRNCVLEISWSHVKNNP